MDIMGAGLLGYKNYLHFELLANFLKVIHGRCSLQPL